MSTTTVKATGLTCNHCAMSVSEEVSEVPGVTGVTVDVVKDGVRSEERRVGKEGRAGWGWWP